MTLLSQFQSSEDLDLDKATELIISTEWDKSEKEYLIGVKSKLMEVFGFSMSTSSTENNNISDKRAKKRDELDSYESLVREAGKSSDISNISN